MIGAKCTEMTGTQDFNNIFCSTISSFYFCHWDICSLCNIIPLNVIHFSLAAFQMCVPVCICFTISLQCTVSNFGFLFICPAWYTLHFLRLWIYVFLQLWIIPIYYLSSTDLPQLMLELCPKKPVINWRCHKSKCIFICLTHQTSYPMLAYLCALNTLINL